MSNWPQISINTEKEFGLCFGCGRDNPIGLKLNFQWDGETAMAEFTPSELHQGWSGTVHGGIIACLLDEAMSYVTYFHNLNCVTAEMRARLRRPVSIGEPLIITSRITKKTRKLIQGKGIISLKDGTLVAEATATLFVVNSERKED